MGRNAREGVVGPALYFGMLRIGETNILRPAMSLMAVYNEGIPRRAAAPVDDQPTEHPAARSCIHCSVCIQPRGEKRTCTGRTNIDSAYLKKILKTFSGGATPNFLNHTTKQFLSC